MALNWIERFASVHALFDAAHARRQRIEERTIDTGEFRTEAVDDDLALRETSGRIAALTHWSFGQLAIIASAPPNYLRTLPAEIASSAINFGLQRSTREQHQRLAKALRDHRHLRSARVLCQEDGSRLSADIVKHHVERAARRAQITQNGVHLTPLVLFASGDARGSGAGDSGVGRA
jgi:hypothetical protein